MEPVTPLLLGIEQRDLSANPPTLPSSSRDLALSRDGVHGRIKSELAWPEPQPRLGFSQPTAPFELQSRAPTPLAEPEAGLTRPRKKQRFRRRLQSDDESPDESQVSGRDTGHAAPPTPRSTMEPAEPPTKGRTPVDSQLALRTPTSCGQSLPTHALSDSATRPTAGDTRGPHARNSTERTRGASPSAIFANQVGVPYSFYVHCSDSAALHTKLSVLVEVSFTTSHMWYRLTSGRGPGRAGQHARGGLYRGGSRTWPRGHHERCGSSRAFTGPR